MSESDFLKQKADQGGMHRSRSVTFSPSVSVPEQSKSTAPAQQMNPTILSASPLSLSIDAPEFRPRANTLPTNTESHSLPTNIPSHMDAFADKRHKRSDRGRKNVATARFYPAISKENLSDKVSLSVQVSF